MQLLAVFHRWLTPRDKRCAGEKRRLERACAQAGVSRSVAKRISTFYFLERDK